MPPTLGQLGPNGQLVLLNPGGQQFNLAPNQQITLGVGGQQQVLQQAAVASQQAPQPPKWVPSKTEPGLHQLDGASGDLLSDDDEGKAKAKGSWIEMR